MCVCKTGEKKITLKRPQRVGTVMADQEVLDIANRRTVRKGFQGWPKQMLPPNSAREGLWNWTVEPDYTCALASMIAFDLLPAPLLPCRARSSRQQRQLHSVFLLSNWGCHRVPGTLWLLQVLNQGQSHQCTWVSYLRAGIINYLLRPSSLHLSHKLGELNPFLPNASVLKTWACEGSRHLLISPGAK